MSFSIREATSKQARVPRQPRALTLARLQCLAGAGEVLGRGVLGPLQTGQHGWGVLGGRAAPTTAPRPAERRDMGQVRGPTCRPPAHPAAHPPARRAAELDGAAELLAPTAGTRCSEPFAPLEINK